MLSIFKNKWIVVALCLALAFVISFVLVPAQVRKEKATTQIIRVNKMIDENSLITENDINIIEVGSFNLPGDIITSKEDIIGKYSNERIYPSDNIIPAKLKSEQEQNDPYYLLSTNNMLAVSVGLKDLQHGVSGKIQTGDIVSVYRHNSSANTTELIPELEYVKVLSLSNNRNIDLDYIDYTDSFGEDRRIPSTITLLVSSSQASKLIAAENQGIIHLALAGRGSEATKLLGGGE